MPHQAKDDERPHDQHCDQCDMAEFQGITYAAAHIKELDVMAREAELQAQVSALTQERDKWKDLFIKEQVRKFEVTRQREVFALQVLERTKELEAVEQERDTLKAELAEVEEQVEQLLVERKQAKGEVTRLREGLKAKVQTTFLSREYDEVLRWRDKFLDPERESDPPPLHPQLACYAIADAMTLREVAALLNGEGEERT